MLSKCFSCLASAYLSARPASLQRSIHECVQAPMASALLVELKVQCISSCMLIVDFLRVLLH